MTDEVGEVLDGLGKDIADVKAEAEQEAKAAQQTSLLSQAQAIMKSIIAYLNDHGKGESLSEKWMAFAVENPHLLKSGEQDGYAELVNILGGLQPPASSQILAVQLLSYLGSWNASMQGISTNPHWDFLRPQYWWDTSTRHGMPVNSRSRVLVMLKSEIGGAIKELARVRDLVAQVVRAGSGIQREAREFAKGLHDRTQESGIVLEEFDILLNIHGWVSGLVDEDARLTKLLAGHSPHTFTGTSAQASAIVSAYRQRYAGYQNLQKELTIQKDTAKTLLEMASAHRYDSRLLEVAARTHKDLSDWLYEINLDVTNAKTDLHNAARRAKQLQASTA